MLLSWVDVRCVDIFMFQRTAGKNLGSVGADVPLVTSWSTRSRARHTSGRLIYTYTPKFH